MNKDIDKISLEDFLTKNARSKEVGLIIIRDQIEAGQIKELLGDNQFKQSDTITNLLDNKKTYTFINDINKKDIYDFAKEYPTGQVRVFDKKEMKSEIFSPDYDNLNIILIVNQAELSNIQKSGLDLLSIVGMCFRV